MMLAIGMLALIFNIQLGKAEPKTWTADADGRAAESSEMRDAITVADPADTSRASLKYWPTPTVESAFEMGWTHDSGMFFSCLLKAATSGTSITK